MNQLNENELLNFIKLATTPYQTVEEGVKILKSAGFTELSMRERWNLQKGSSYFVVPYATSLYAFTVGAQWTEGQNMRIAAAHTDQPGFRVKPCADMVYRDYLKLDTEVYGGPILNTWMDRPLSIAGRVALRSDDPFHPLMRTIDMKKPVLTIPNMAIHINRDVNKGFELNKQTDTLPLFAMKPSDDSKNSQLESGEGTKDFFINYLAESLSIKQTDILNYDLYIYNAEEGCFLGMNGEFISGPRLDNLTSVFALLKGITEGRRSSGINLIALYDNEEIGSRSKQGADSAFLNMLLKKVYIGLNCSK
jgi:aspartyl aminopeptidase